MASLLEVFVEKGQDINVTDDEGSTALHSAVVNNSPTACASCCDWASADQNQ